ncbi:MAG: hypothetical protein JSR17_00485 [Proteobacteria bacterium]|nr:hypothetical protein [Pseudomonadota bacterium]
MSLGSFFGQVAGVAQTVLSSNLFSAFTKANTLRTMRAEEHFILKSQELSVSQKILPSTGIAIAGGATLVGLSSLVIGLPFFVPSMFFLTSLAGVAFDLSYYLAERAERANLRDVFISIHDLQKAINKERSLSKKQKQHLLDYSMGQSELILGLFELRFVLINNQQLTLKKKEALIRQINHLIEALMQDKHISLKSLQQAITLPELDFSINRLMDGLKIYEQARRQIKGFTVSAHLRQQVKHYRKTQAKVFALDLTVEDKEALLKLLEDKTLNAPKIKLLLAKIGFRFLNQTAHQQVWLQDKKMNEFLINEKITGTKLGPVVRFYQLPRQVSYHLHEIYQLIEENKKLKPRIKQTLVTHIHTLQQELKSPFCSKKMVETWEELSQLLVKHKLKTKAELKKISTLILDIELVYKKFQKIIKQQENTDLKELILKHRLQTLGQYITGLNFKFSLPQCKWSEEKATPLEAVVNEIENSALVHDIQSLENSITHDVQRLVGELESVLFGESDNTQSGHLAENLRKTFADNYGTALDIIQKAERLKYLEMAAPRHFVNMGIDIACAAIPFGPAIPALQYLNYTLPVLSAANGLELSVRTKHAQATLNEGLFDLTSGIIPQFTLGKQPVETPAIPQSRDDRSKNRFTL